MSHVLHVSDDGTSVPGSTRGFVNHEEALRSLLFVEWPACFSAFQRLGLSAPESKRSVAKKKRNTDV